MIVCICRRVSDRDIVRAARQGLDFDAIQIELGVGRHCGQCLDCACNIVQQCQSEAPVSALRTVNPARALSDVT